MAILQVLVPDMLKVPIHTSKATISTCWRHQSQRESCKAIFKGLWNNTTNAIAMPCHSLTLVQTSLWFPPKYVIQGGSPAERREG